MAQKICCGGFNLGEGLELDGKTLKAIGSGGMVVTANIIFSEDSLDDPLVTADKTYEEVLGHLMSGGNVVVNAVYQGDDRLYLMSFLGAMYGEVVFTDAEGHMIGVEEDGWYVRSQV